MKMESLAFLKKYWYLNVLFIIICIIVFVSRIKNNVIENEAILKEYPDIQNSEFINGIVSNTIKIERGNQIRIELRNGVKKTIGWASNGFYQPKDMYNFIQNNDSISKSIGSDTLFVYRGIETYHFELFKRLNENNDGK